MKRAFLAIGLCLSLLLLLLTLGACANGSEAQDAHVAPNISVTDVNGNTVSLSDYRGKPVVVNFWATWCPPCVGELPHIDKAVKTYGDRVTFLMVNVDSDRLEDIAIAKAFMRENGFSFPIYFDLGQQASYTYGVSSIPMTVWIDERGCLENVAVGMLSEEYLTYYIEQMLAD